MRVSYNWLLEWIDLTGITPEEVADKLTNAGIEVDEVIHTGQDIKDVVVGYVIEAKQHPNADKLSVCTVDVGQPEPLTIVCGAANVATGQYVPVAVPGAVLPGGFKIKRTKLRGVESQGMICSGKELGMNNKLVPTELQEGIYVLPQATIGADAIELMNLKDSILELDLTPNRSDCLSLLGVAYELAALYGREVKLPNSDVQETGDVKTADVFSLEVKDEDLCPRYAGRIVSDVKISTSPMWLRNKLQAAGIRSINNIVDITNLILLEFGQPLHAFDFDELAEQKIIVRRAKENENMTTLDDIERKLTSDMLVIADGKQAVAIAGVMGGVDSEVTEKTNRILIEAAHFNPVSIRRTATAFGLRTEASIRFEKGTDITVIDQAINRAANLMAELGGGYILPGVVDSHQREFTNKCINISEADVNAKLGTKLQLADIKDYFQKLHFTVNEFDNNILEVLVPGRRKDINIKEDLVEEVARLYGYANIPATLPVGQSTQGKLTQEQQLRRKVRDCLINSGWHEAVSYSLVNPNRVLELGLDDDALKKMIPLSMPLSEDRSHLRNMMMPSMLEMAQHNINHNNDKVKLFEIGTIYLPKNLPLTELPVEKKIVAAICYGLDFANSWQKQQSATDFWSVKGSVEQLLDMLGITASRVRYMTASIAAMHPGQTAKLLLDGEYAGFIGQIHPQVAKMYDLPQSFYFELDYDKIIKNSKPIIEYKSLPRYPSMRRDIAIVLDEQVAAGDILQAVQEAAGELLADINLFDLYKGTGIAEGKKSLALSMLFLDYNKTLTDEAVQCVMDSIIKQLKNNWGAELRK